MKNSDVLLYIAGNDEFGVRIHVQIANEENTETLIFSDHGWLYEKQFVQWIKAKMEVPIESLNFIFCGDPKSEFPLYSELYSAGAKVSLVS
ncbi:hypothetical protein [Aliikangiella coralliicola]|uniref:Uncharacterized protein n=1 Tax=Aliikangiella coralliicola TaxID=2592383 RepID=A0A545UJB2_9GAMM|nr:hypothetical protein [Aliikangiella coralliicola]TQV89523.1 hypothetical protein FLL46_01170 [Aliikangiella coralliicola]